MVRKSILVFLLSGVSIAQTAMANPIFVTTTAQGVTDAANCSLQEAIYAANFDAAIAIDATAPDHFYTTGCLPGSGADIIYLPDGAFFQMDSISTDAHNPFGPTATPIIFSTITIEANGATIMAGPNAPNMRAFAFGDASIATPNGAVSSSGHVTFTLRNAYIKGFHVHGGNGASGGGGGLGAGGAIYTDADADLFTATLSMVIENSTFDGNSATGGNGSANRNSGPGGGGGGLSGNGGVALGDLTGTIYPNSGGGGGGGGARGDGGANGGRTPVCNPVEPGCNGGWASLGGGGGGGTVFSGSPSYSLDPNIILLRAGGYLCGGPGGGDRSDGSDGTCPGGGGGGGGVPDQITFIRYGGDGGKGGYGGGGGGGGFHNSPDPTATFGRQGGDGGWGGGGGGGGQDDSGGNGGFGGGGGAGAAISGSSLHGFGGRGKPSGGGAGAGLGGAIFSHWTFVTIKNSTFTNNTVSHGSVGDTDAGQGNGFGGAIFAVDGSLSVLNSTIATNHANDVGGGIFVAASQTDLVTSATLRNTIVAKNGAQECFLTDDVTAEGSGNLIVNNSGCPGVVVAIDPNLQALLLNTPGLTPTMAIDAKSPAYNAADAGTSLAFDQRGVPRPQATAFDIGAYEFIKPSADLAIAKTTVGDPYAGQYFSWIIDVENQGPTAAQNVGIVDTLPAGVLLSTVVGSGGFNCTGTATVTCTKGSMSAGEIDSLTITAFVPPSLVYGTTITNAASISSTTPDPNASNNSAAVSATIKTLADLSIVQAGPAAPMAGRDAIYTITAANLGPSHSPLPTVSDVVPAGTSFVSLTARDDWHCTTPAVGTPGPAAISCTTSTFAVSDAATFTLVVHVSPSAQHASELCNRAVISPSILDPVLTNNTSQMCGTVQTSADLVLTQTVTTSGTAGRGSASFNVSVKNNGPSDSQNISLVASSSVFSAQPPVVTASGGGTCSVAGPNVTCTWASLPLLATDSVTITASWRSAVGQVCDTVTVQAGTADPNAQNNGANACAGKK